MHKVLGSLILALFVAVPALARVVSYAPYTSRYATVGHHERTTRYMVLLEEIETHFGYGSERRDVVLYDTSGREEPRLVFQAAAGAYVHAVALYEPKSQGSSGERTPWLLLSLNDVDGQKVMFSSDAGASWREVEALRHASLHISFNEDQGGPFTRGLTATVRTGNDQWPFVLTADGIWAVSAAGQAKKIYTGFYPRAVGQNAEGTLFLVQAGTTVDVVGLDGTTRNVTSTLFSGSAAYGWITPAGDVYLLVTRNEGQFLYLHRRGRLEFVSGPYDVPAPPIDQPTAGPYLSREHFFAVPSSDFGSAWIIQRKLGRPTTLSRHSPGMAAAETMWSDVTGPEVEALIAGASGETLLVQVHRPRSTAVGAPPFIDPALAVWRVGEPAPARYDELYLQETSHKGFVHVDVDRIAAGEPFVFFSGDVFDDIIVSPAPSPGGGDVMQEWGVVRASLKQRLVLPGVARLHGAFDSFWMTDVFIYNPETTPQGVTVQFATMGEPAQASEAGVRLLLGAGETRFVPDVLKALFGIENGGGALTFVPDSAVVVTSRTYSRKGEGTFGFGMQAIDLFNAAGPRFPVSFSGAFPGEHFRTNLLLTDTSGRGTAARMSAAGVSGVIGRTVEALAAPAGGILQFNGIGPSLALDARESGALLLQPTRGTAIATLVSIDNRTNDPTYFPPDLSSGLMRDIPVVGHLDGANGSRFRSDLYLLNPADYPQTVNLEAKQWDAPTRRAVQFTLLPQEGRMISDVLWRLFGMTGLARLRYASWNPGSGIRATSRTYTVEESGATYGCLIPPLNNFQSAAGGERLEIIGVGGGNGYRTNLGLVELTARQSGSVAVDIAIFSGSGEKLDGFRLSVPAGGGMQIGDIFASRGLPQPQAARIVVDVVEPGMIGAYATVTDNVTNDSIFLGANLGARP